MLQGCCECIFGSPTNETNNDHSFIPLNHMNQYTPVWSDSQWPKNTFLVSRKLRTTEDSISVSGIMKMDPSSLSISLITGHDSIDYQNIALELNANFNNNVIQIRSVENGISKILCEESMATDLLTGLNFKLYFAVRTIVVDGGTINIKYGPDDNDYKSSFLGQFDIKHNFNDIEYVQINGDIEYVKTFQYNFGSPVNEGIYGESNEMVFLIPRCIKNGDIITVSGKLKTDPKNFSIGLVAGQKEIDYNNIACQLNADFVNDVLTTKIVENGVKIPADDNDMPASTLATGPNYEFDLCFTYTAKEDRIPVLDISNTYTFIYETNVKHNVNDIRYVVIHGDIEHVKSFQFDMAQN